MKSRSIWGEVNCLRTVLRPALWHLHGERMVLEKGPGPKLYEAQLDRSRLSLIFSCKTYFDFPLLCFNLSLCLMDCMSCMGPLRVPDQSNVIGCPASCLEKGLKPVLLLAHGQCFWYTLLLWNQPEIFLEHFDTILSSRCLVYIYVYTTMECSSYCGSNHQLILQDLTRENYLSYLIVKKYEYIILMSPVLLLF